ncbi:MAG: hypothetical protein AB9891_02185 [Anaerolineaceae bacterium]
MNSIPPEQISARALDFLERLVTEIGPRPAGSPAEKQAQEMIGRILTDKGLRLLWMDVPFSRQSPFLFHNFLAGVGLLAAVETLASGFPCVSLLMPLLDRCRAGIDLVDQKDGAARRQIQQQPPALPENTAPEDLDLILVAHVDTARARPASGELWYQWREQSFEDHPAGGGHPRHPGNPWSVLGFSCRRPSCWRPRSSAACC